MSNLTVGGAGSAQWPERDWSTSSRKDAVERVDSIQKVVDDQRALGALAGGVARYTSATAAPTQQDFEVATRLGPNGVTVKSLDQLVNAPKVDRNPFNPVADRKSVNGYDHIMESLRTAALKRDAALAGTSSTPGSASSTSDTAATSVAPSASATTLVADKPRAANEFGEAYVRNAIAAYARNSSLTAPTTPEPTPAPPPTPAPEPTTPPPTTPSGSGSTGVGGLVGGFFGH
jgi:hypothetical protein